MAKSPGVIQQFVTWEKVVAWSVAINSFALSTLVYFVIDLSKTMTAMREMFAASEATQQAMVKRIDRIENKVDYLHNRVDGR